MRAADGEDLVRKNLRQKVREGLVYVEVLVSRLVE